MTRKTRTGLSFSLKKHIFRLMFLLDIDAPRKKLGKMKFLISLASSYIIANLLIQVLNVDAAMKEEKVFDCSLLLFSKI